MAENGKTFTQDEVNQMIAERLKREKNTLDAYKAQMAAEAAAQAEAEAMQQRFAAALGNNREVLHPRLTDLMVSDFAAAVNDPANAGKDDQIVFAELFADQGYLKPKGAKIFESSPVLPRPGSASADDAVRAAFGLSKKE